MTDRELMQMALDALENNWLGTPRREVMDSIRARLAQPEPPYLKFSGTTHVVCQCDKCRSQPEPEPVAWMYTEVLMDDDRKITRNVMFRDYDSGVGIPLYTAPPQRKWQGLTDEEISELWVDTEQRLLMQDFARAIESKLKEKNNG